MLTFGSAVLVALLSGPSFPALLSADTLHQVGPAAELAGMGPGASLLQDEAFSLVDREAYEAIRAERAEEMLMEHRALASGRASAEAVLAASGIEARVEGRIKSMYSLHAKMQRKNLSMDQVLDRVALRVIVPTIADAYEIQRLMHAHLDVVAEAQDDYIAQPKASGYQALHTAVIERATRLPVEIQIRTEAMNEAAEHGEAAHWRYKLQA